MDFNERWETFWWIKKTFRKSLIRLFLNKLQIFKKNSNFYGNFKKIKLQSLKKLQFLFKLFIDFFKASQLDLIEYCCLPGERRS
jgi:hypothetical protein